MKIAGIFAIAALFAMQTAAHTPQQIRAMLPEVAGWTIDDEIEVFDKDNLYDRINGAAPLFIENNFREMTSTQYRKGDEYITVQAYRHATPENAFGMYASERSSGLEFFPYGGEAQGDESNMYFFAGNVYVKMWSSSGEEVGDALKTIAEGFARNIDPEAGYPPIAKAFPAEGKTPHTEAYITSSYLGHEFLNSVFTAEYRLEGEPYQAFVIDAESEERAEKALGKWLAFTKQNEKPVQGRMLLNDRYNGDIPVLWSGPYIIGIYNENDKQMTSPDVFLENILAGLP